MSIYAEFLPDAKEMLEEFGILCSVDPDKSCLAMISDPVLTQVLEAGGYCDKLQFTLKIAAATEEWTTSDLELGSNFAAIINGSPISNFQIGNKLSIDNRVVRINSLTHKPGSAWITMVVVDENQ
jgi:hypothetical protein